MIASNSSFRILTISLFFLILAISFFGNPTFAQTTSKPEYLSLLDSVKTFYGDTCCIGVNSNLIKRLYGFQKYTPVKNYLNSYEAIRKNIEGFRKTYLKSIYDEQALLLDLSRIFSDSTQQNIVNLCGIYLGPDSVTSIGLSYIILRSNPAQFYSRLYQVVNFDQAFKEEITNYGDEWFYSKKLKELMELPLK